MKYLLDIFWERADFVQTKKAIRNLSATWPRAYAKWVEAAANGSAIISELQTEVLRIPSLQSLPSARKVMGWVTVAS